MLSIESPATVLNRLITRIAYPELGVGQAVQERIETALSAEERSVVVVTMERWGRKIVREGRLIRLDIDDELRGARFGIALKELSLANQQSDPNKVMLAVNNLVLGSPSVPLSKRGVL